MKRFTILDLNFCENAPSDEKQLSGSGSAYSVSYSTAKDTFKSTGYVSDYSVSHDGYKAKVGGYVVGAVAGAISGAISVGGVTYTYTSANTGKS